MGRTHPCYRAGLTFYEWFWGFTREPVESECWEWCGTRLGGYGKVSAPGRSHGTTFAHRIAWILAKGPIPPGLYVLHRCDNPPCVRPSHLFLGTQRDNVDDMLAKGRRRKAQ